jgi:hypothetical protein
MSQTSTDNLAQKIARILEAESPAADLSSLQASIDKLSERLERIEQNLSGPTETPKPTFIHPSQDRFAIAEAIADQVFAGVQKEKACTFEPNGKPCDHCSMCSSRGF